MIKIIAIVLGLFVVALAGVYWHGANLKPQKSTVEKVIPDERFPQ